MLPKSLKNNLQFLVPLAWNNTHVLVSTKRNLHVYKKVRYCNNGYTGHSKVIQLTIPINALIVMPRYYHSAYSHDTKCRTNRAISHGQGFSFYKYNFKYEISKIVKPKNRFSKTLKTCAAGIHFFFTKKEAQRYLF